MGYAPGPSSVWNFYADGTGQFCESSAVVGEYVTWFEWLAQAERTLQFRTTKEGKVQQSGEVLFAEWEEEPTEWVTITYDFKVIEYYGPQVVMFQVPEQKTFKFWTSLDYLYYAGVENRTSLNLL
ncbi:MAG: hypothetical protein AB8B99_16265 [Phormidesmis sp.]